MFWRTICFFKFVFHLSPEKEVSDDLNIVRVTPVFKGGDRSE